MTTTGETPKVTLGDRFARAAAVFLDRRVLVVLGKPLGHRRGWLVFSQIVLMGTIVFLGASPQREFPLG